MLNVSGLKACWVAKGLNQKDVATMLSMSEKTLSLRLKKGIFNSNEMAVLIRELEIQNPLDIFFAPN